MTPHVLHHEDLDLCVMKLHDEKKALQVMARHGVLIQPLEVLDTVPNPATVSYATQFKIPLIILLYLPPFPLHWW